MQGLIFDVEEFHRACDVPIATTPAVPSQSRIDLRISLIDEEVNKELLPAMRANDMLEIADAMADAIYVIVGAAIEYGIDLACVWNAVQEANMAKVDPITGKVKYRDDGKVLKPNGWQPPDIQLAVYGTKKGQ